MSEKETYKATYYIQILHNKINDLIVYFYVQKSPSYEHTMFHRYESFVCNLISWTQCYKWCFSFETHLL